MRTIDFISKEVYRINNGGRGRGSCSSVFADGTAIYSYGYHYPLLFTIQVPSGAILWVRNTAGYSATTSKHIAWAGVHQDIDAPLPYGQRYGGHHENTSNYDTVVQAIRGVVEKTRKEMASKKRHDTQVYEHLRSRLAKNLRYMVLLEATV